MDIINHLHIIFVHDLVEISYSFNSKFVILFPRQSLLEAV